MAIKYSKGKARLWKSQKEERPGLGIRFSKDTAKREIDQIHQAIKTILTLKYGKGIKSKK